MRILITDSTSFLGSYLVKEALHQGHHVVAHIPPDTASPFWSKDRKLTAVTGNLRLARSIPPMLEGVDCVIHAATEASCMSDSVIATENLLHAMESRRVKRVILISSLSVHDFSSIAPWSTLTEESPTDSACSGREEYTTTRIVEEELTRRWSRAHDTPLTIYRPGLIIGPNNLWFSKLGIQLFDQKWLQVGPSIPLPCIDVRDCASAIIQGLNTPKTEKSVINLVGDHSPTAHLYMKELCNLYPETTSLPFPWRLMQVTSRALNLFSQKCTGGKMKVSSYFHAGSFEWRSKPMYYSNDRAKELIGWQPKFDWRSSIRASVAEENKTSL